MPVWTSLDSGDEEEDTDDHIVMGSTPLPSQEPFSLPDDLAGNFNDF